MIARVNEETSGVSARSAEAPERLAAALADPHLRERQPELVRERALHVLGQLGDRPVEAEPGLDADGEQVERIRQRGADPLAAPAGVDVDEVVGAEEADEHEEEPEQQPDAAGGSR